MQPSSSKLAKLSLAFGILSFLIFIIAAMRSSQYSVVLMYPRSPIYFISLITPLLAIIMGIIAKKKIKAGIAQGGKMATAGITLGVIYLAALLLLIAFGLLMVLGTVY